MVHAKASTDVAIVGGGVCGLTTALALEREGLSPTVYEAASEYRSVGAGILLQTNALLVLDRLGIADRVRSAGVPLADVRFLAETGRTLQRFDLDGLERAEFGYGHVAIHRGDLLRILLDELDSPVETDKACANVADADRPTARFEDGTRIRPDVLVGADGIHSTVRDAIAPDAELRSLDATVFRAVASCELPARHRGRGLEVWGQGTYTGGAPIAEDRFYWFATVPRDVAPGSTDPRTRPDRLRASYGDFPEPIPTVVDSFAPDETVITTGLEDVPPLETWSRGSVVLAGDAAHGMLPFAGQGGAQAIEDAISLAAALGAHDDHARAFDTYERTRTDRADRIRTEARWLGKLGTTRSSVGCRARNRALDLLPDAVFRRLRRRRVARTSLPDGSVVDATT